MTITIRVPFDGFYAGPWAQSENEYNERYNAAYCDGDLKHLRYFDDWGFSPDYRDRVVGMFVETYLGLVNDMLGVDIIEVSHRLKSPMYYNFANDEIYVDVEVGDYEEFVKQILSHLDTDIKIRDKVAKTIKDCHTDYDGYISFLSNDLDEWRSYIYDPDDNRYISCLIAYIMKAMDSYVFDNMSGMLLSEAAWNGLHTVEPQTDEAIQEYDDYQMFGAKYIDFAIENKDDPFFDELWDEKRNELIAEQKRREAFAKLPKIPGL